MEADGETECGNLEEEKSKSRWRERDLLFKLAASRWEFTANDGCHNCSRGFSRCLIQR
jgi:hypothetical protein